MSKLSEFGENENFKSESKVTSQRPVFSNTKQIPTPKCPDYSRKNAAEYCQVPLGDSYSI